MVKKKYNQMENNFLCVFSRIKAETDIKNFTQLSEILGISQPAISKTKKKGVFPTEWAFQLELKHGLLTRWILTGEGPKRHGEGTEQTQKAKQTATFLAELEAWARESAKGGDIGWLEDQLETYFPAFRIWREKNAKTDAETDQVA